MTRIKTLDAARALPLAGSAERIAAASHIHGWGIGEIYGFIDVDGTAMRVMYTPDGVFKTPYVGGAAFS